MLFVAACVFLGGVATFAVLAYLGRRRQADTPGIQAAE
jgi:hypothetical protein